MQILERFLLEIVLSVVLIVLGYLLRIVNRKIIESVSRKNAIRIERRLLLEKFSSFSITAFAVICLILVWGVNVTSIFVLVTSILGVIGIAFFAGWSLLSNIFAAFLLFYASPFKMEDEVTVMDGPNTVTGRVVNMTLFFVFVEDAEGNRVTVPNNLVLQRAVMTRTRKQEA